MAARSAPCCYWGTMAPLDAALTADDAPSPRALAATRTAEDAPSRLAIFATIVGNFLEFFDFGVYALFAVMIGRTFFPVASASGQLLLSVGTFGVGFVMR